MEGIPIRPARRGDVPSLHALWQAMMAEHARLDPRLAVHAEAPAWMAAHLGQAVADPHRLIFVAEEGSRLVVGFVSARLLPFSGAAGEEREAEIGECFVAPARRRRGVARRLVQRVLDALDERRIASVRIQVAALNPGALGFWRSLDFRPVETILERA
jgi:ribosomal protein S18 acetylase RimI-like enzyme